MALEKLAEARDRVEMDGSGLVVECLGGSAGGVELAGAKCWVW
jgi:hypothetical protein